jgi:hypothetical protein
VPGSNGGIKRPPSFQIQIPLSTDVLSSDTDIKCVICDELWPPSHNRHVEPLRQEPPTDPPLSGDFAQKGLVLAKPKKYSLVSRLRGSLKNPAPKERHNLAHSARSCEKIEKVLD